MKSRVKIAVLCDRLGPYHFAQLKAASRHAEIIAIEFSTKDQTYEWEVIKGASGFIRVTLFSDPVDMQPVNAVIKKVNNALAGIKPQVVAIPGWDAPASLFALWWCLHNNTPSIIMSDSQKDDVVRVWWKEWVKRQIVKLNSSGFVAGLPHIDYLKSLGMPEKRIFTGCDIVDNAFFAEKARGYQQESAAVRKRLGLPEKYFLASSRFILEKNIFLLLQAYAKYCQKTVGDPWKLILLGDGPLKSQIIRHREKLGLSNDVLLPGFKQYEELPAFYGLAGAFIHASTQETWGLVVNEAMACGLPVIVSSHCGCATDLVRHACNGFVFDPYDSEELANHMAFVSGDTCNRGEMGEASRNIIDCWSLETFASNLVDAANAAREADSPRFDYISKALLWGLMHRRRSHRKKKQS